MLKSYTARLTALYAVLFALAVLAVGGVTLFATRAALQKQFDDSISTEAHALVREYQTEGLEGVRQAVTERDSAPGALDYGLDGPGGRRLAGRLAGVKSPLGWAVLQLTDGAEGVEGVRIYTVDIADGYRLRVGDDMDRAQALDGVIVEGFAIAFLGVVLLGALGGYGMSRGIRRRLAAITGTAQAIIDGDLARRVAVEGAHHDLDQLALTFNQMLDRIALLMESVRQVSSDVAHDLRTPLTRLRHRLEAGLAGPAEARAEILEGAMADLDAILATFSALLRIAQIDAGSRRSTFRTVDLTVVARRVIEAFAPVAEEGGRALLLDAPDAILTEGDDELLIQMLVNLVENGLRHTPAGATITVAASADPAPALTVTDNGAGVPAGERDKVLDRFYRLEQSRSTPGAGLGLSLAAAVARLHRASLTLSDAAPGLRVEVVFPKIRS